MYPEVDSLHNPFVNRSWLVNFVWYNRFCFVVPFQASIFYVFPEALSARIRIRLKTQLLFSVFQ